MVGGTRLSQIEGDLLEGQESVSCFKTWALGECTSGRGSLQQVAIQQAAPFKLVTSVVSSSSGSGRSFSKALQSLRGSALTRGWSCLLQPKPFTNPTWSHPQVHSRGWNFRLQDIKILSGPVWCGFKLRHLPPSEGFGPNCAQKDGHPAHSVPDGDRLRTLTCQGTSRTPQRSENALRMPCACLADCRMLTRRLPSFATTVELRHV